MRTAGVTFIGQVEWIEHAPGKILEDETLYCEEIFMPKTIRALTEELGEDETRRAMLTRKYVRYYLQDSIAQGKRNMLKGFKRASDNVFYGNEALLKLSGGVQKSEDQVQAFLLDALRNEVGQIVFRSLQAGVWSAVGCKG